MGYRQLGGQPWVYLLPQRVYKHRVWHAIYTGSRKEQVASAYLALMGAEMICPMTREVRRTSLRGGNSRFAEVEVPLFPRYVFARIVGSLYSWVNDAPRRVGRLHIVATAGGPLNVPDKVVEAFREIKTTEQSTFKVGDRVRIDGLSGLIATIASIEGLVQNQAVSVWLEMLGARRRAEVQLTRVSAN